ncbi:hypothetical protein [Dyadobacter sp. LHD-138]|uniref:hypothetical protein n=1 Tax=Dyadobacter sp. LHD-138 TaxID=3071413 RepID=UPI0027E1CDCC|nr:hypothetical protein [Dyadobacter sp. LHD-138]MDQ6482521.1 hypothetical protein [Dyadobacter sp. LHD-138]
MKILFWFRQSEATSKNENDPFGTIQCRIKIDTQSIEIGATPVSCKKSAWNSADQIVLGSNLRSTNFNKALHAISTNLSRLFDILSTKYDFVSPATVKEYYLSKKKFIYTMAEISKGYFAHREKEVAKNIITQSTYDVNENYARHILDFCATQKLVKPIQIPPTFFTDLFNFMIDDGRTGQRMARKIASFAKQMLKWAKKNGMSPKLSCFDETLPGKNDSEDNLDTTHLSIPQIEKLYNFDFHALVDQGIITKQTATMLSHERYAFIFNCFTGMHHVDYTKKDFLLEEFYGALFIRGSRYKTKIRFSVKLLEPAVEILKLYNNKLENLPIKSNQKRNETLKIVAMYAGIPLKLTTKVARKTFCDLALNEMLMSADDVAACLGLKSTRHLKNYGRIRERRLMKTMTSWGELKQAS